MSEAAAVPATSGSTIEIQGLRHQYRNGPLALAGVDLTIGTGLFGLLGPNGAGKSTLMRIVCTLMVPTAGQVRVHGHDVVRERRQVRAMLGYLPQDFGAWRLMRVEETLNTLALLSGMRDGAERRKRVRETLEQVGLAEVADRKFKKLSGGMKRRLGVAQALVHDPSVIVVDEPTVGLDPEERLRFRKLMADLSTQRTIVLSTHIVADLGSSCRHLAVIDKGEIQFNGSPADLIQGSRGIVFQMELGPGATESALGGGAEIVSKSRTDTGTLVRAVRDDAKMPDGARPVDAPTFEEAYLAFMASRGRVEAAATTEGAAS